jgi:hypothetical protein
LISWIDLNRGNSDSSCTPTASIDEKRQDIAILFPNGPFGEERYRPVQVIATIKDCLNEAAKLAHE